VRQGQLEVEKRREIFVRSPIGRWHAVVAVLTVGLLVAGCGAETAAAPDSEEVLLQPAAAQGPDPYTPSTVRDPASPPPSPARPGATSSPSGPVRTLRTVSGSTAGLYGGTEFVGSCDVERQVGFLSGNRAKARAFARGAAVGEANIPAFLRGLTPVVLRADARVTNHGFRDGSATAYQAVLQAGTAVLVDQYGVPRVRCACGNPLKPPVAVKGTVVHKGKPWAGYGPEQAIVIQPGTTVVNSLMIVNVVDNAWIERKAGTQGERDMRPDMPPDVDPGDVFKESRDTDGTRPSDPASPGDPTGLGQDANRIPAPAPAPPAPDCPTPPPLAPGEEPSSAPTVPPGCPIPTRAEPEEPPVNPRTQPPVVPDAPSGEGLPQSGPDPFLPSEVLAEPGTFQG
jgi:hypothetical protein